MVVDVDVGEVELAVGEDDEDALSVVELAEEASVLFVVDAVDVGVEPHLASAEGGVAVTLQSDAVDGFLGEHVAAGGTSLDEDVGKVAFEEDAHARIGCLDAGVEGDFDDFCLAVGIGGEVHDFAARSALRDVVLFVAGEGGDVEALDKVGTFLAVAIDDVVGGALVVFLEHLHMEHVLADKDFLCHADDFVLAVFVEDDNVVDVGTVADELVLLQAGADEAFVAVDVEFLVGFGNLGGDDGFEVLDFSAARMVGTILVLEELEPADGDLRHACQVFVDVGNLCFDAGDELVVLVFREFGDALHLDFEQTEDVLLAHLADELRIEGGEPFVDVFAELVGGVGILEGFAFVDALFDEDAFQGGEEELFFQLVLAYLQFFAQERLGELYGGAQHVADGEELGFVVFDDAAVGRNVDFAVGEGIEGIDGFV